MTSEVGSGQVAIFPTFKGFRKAVTTEVDGATTASTSRFSSRFGKVAGTTGSTAGKQFTKAFASTTSDLGTASLAALEKSVASSSSALSKARLSEQDAIGKVRVATAQLTETTSKYGDSNSRTIAASEKLSSTQRNLASIQDTVKSRTTSLLTSQLALAKGQQALVDGVGKSTSGFRSFFSTIGNSGAFQGVLSGAQNVGRALTTGIGNALTAVGEKFVSMAKLGATAVTGLAAVVAGATVVGGISRLLTIETAQAKLKALGNTASDVAEIMANANTAVIGTQYSLADAVTVAASAVAAGIKPGASLAKYLRLVANTAAISGDSLSDVGSALNNVQTRQAAYNDSLEIFAQKGIPIYQLLGKQLGKTADQIFDLASQGKISAAVFNEALTNGIGEAAVAVGQTTVGSFDNVKAAMARTGAALVGPSLSQFGKFFLHVQGFFNDLTVNYAPKAAKALSDVTEKALGFATKFLDTVGAIAKSDEGFTLANIRAQFEKAFPKSSGFFQVADSLKTVLPTLADALKKVAPSLAKVLPPLAELASQVLPLIAKLLPVITPALVDALGSISTFVSTVSGLLDPDIWRKFFDPDVSDDQLATKLQGSNSTILQSLGNNAAVMDAFVTDQDRQFNEFFSNLGDSLANGASQIANWWTGRVAQVQTGTAQIGSFFGTLGTQIGSFFTTVANGFAGFGLQIATFVSGVNTNIGLAVAFIAGLPTKALVALGSVGTTLYNSGKSLITGFANGISDAAKNVSTAVAKVMKILAGFFPHSPAKYGPFSGSGWTAVENSGGALFDQFSDGFSSDKTLRLASAATFTVAGGSTSTGGVTSGSRAAAAGGFVNNGTIVTQDPEAFFALAEKKKRRANALAGIGGVTS